jgi:hypothetical protein
MEQRMAIIELFPQDHIVGIFRGFQKGGLEFHADLVLPYRNDFQSIPMHGQFLLIQLETINEAVLGRIASFSSRGKLSSSSGEEFSLRALRDNRSIPEDLREVYLKYKVNIRVLGVLRIPLSGKLIFVASHRRLPHVGSQVAFPSSAVLQEIVGHTIDGAAIGHFALGEYIYASGSNHYSQTKGTLADWMQIKPPEVLVKFPVHSLVARRSFIFARAGFGKSNLNKLLFSKLYEHTPTVTKRGGRNVPVGTIIFDPDGEYFWPDDKGRPGLCDVPTLQEKLVVFTSRKGPSAFYDSFVAGSIKLDIRRLSPADVMSIALGAEKQDQQNVRKLRGLDSRNWGKLVDLIDQSGNQTSLDDITILLGLDNRQQEVEALAARANMTAIVRMLHDKSSQFMDMLLYALSEGKLCIVDTSQMRGSQALILSGLILRRIFDRNQEEFTKAEPKTIPTIVVVEEAQSVLNERATVSEPYISWVKEGRKYDLGALLITQQPGSIPVDILSQGDNWFIFHLLSSTDLLNVQRANAHFSEDILSVLLNEPIPGQGVFWSSVGGKPYPVSIRVLSFEHVYCVLDLDYTRAAADTFAQRIKTRFQKVLAEHLEHRNGVSPTTDSEIAIENGVDAEPIDVLAAYKSNALEALRTNTDVMGRLHDRGIPWGAVMRELIKALPDTLEDRDDVAYDLVREALEQICGPENEGWHTFKRPNKDGKQITWVKVGK